MLYHLWHLECLPGYTKYSIDLGYNVDIILPKCLKESMEKFEPKDNLKIFEYSEINEIETNLKKFKSKIKKYKFSFIGTLDSNHFEFYKKWVILIILKFYLSFIILMKYILMQLIVYFQK